MRRYAVYLEIGPAGDCLAHVPDLPGCNLAAASQEAALAALPGAVGGYLAWLRRHGVAAAPPGEPLELVVVETVRQIGPFHPGDAAALFAWDRAPLGREEMERFFRVAACSRADLLALVRRLPPEIIAWRETAASFSIGRILRHIGNAEEWYVSRVVEPETLPAEWEDDDQLPLFRFLAMERRTAVGRLRQMSDEELARVSFPTRWTDHPDEAWTARKAIRRLLEHEQEHLGHVRQILNSCGRHARR